MRQRKPPEHGGIDVIETEEHVCYCHCAGKSDSSKTVKAYRLVETGGMDTELTVCSACAVKLALKILELETL